MIALDTQINSPFKFLDSYKKKDIHTYFGRDKESLELFELYKDSTIMILHGPSGSGKTSLIYCGLLNRIRKDKEVISIRRDDNLINAIKKKLFSEEVHKDNGNSKPSELIDIFFSHHSDLNSILSSLDHTEGMMLDIEEEIIRIKRKKKPSPLYKSKSNNNSSLEAEDTETIIKKNKERLTQFVNERKKLLEKLRQKNKEVNQVSDKIHDFFMYQRNTDSGTPFNPLVIFDQFEELFVYGSEEEIDKFGLFLKLIFDYKIPFNIIISLREEYFGYLDQLQSYIPYIFYKKLRLAHPNEQVVKNIIEKSFNQFNINQQSEITKDELPETEKQKRIELILDQIKIIDNENTSYHLPFLQVYLDSIYKVDYHRTYGETPAQDKYLPLEFKEDEIKEFGSIEQVLENYIREVNYKIIRNTNNKLNNRVQHRDSVIKFLRHFKTKDGLKKRIPIQVRKEDCYDINDRKVLNKIQTDLWGDINDEEYNETISEIIYELKQKGILNLSSDKKIGEDYAELSHDIIAKIIGNLRTEDDFRSLVKKDFISSFDIYDDTKLSSDLLSAQQIERMNQCLDYIMEDDNADRLKRKQQFFKASIEESQKEELEKRKLEKRLRMFVYYPFIITCLLIFSAALSYSLIQLAKENSINKLSIKIHEKMSNALRDYNVDRTNSFKYILESEDILKEERENNKFLYFVSDLLSGKSTSNDLDNDSIFDIVKNFKNDFYNEYNKIPFYHNSIALSDGSPILGTKTRKIRDDLYIYTLTSNSLTLMSVKYKEKNAIHDTLFKRAGEILDFEPFVPYENSTKLMTLIASRNPEDNRLKFILINKKGEEQPISIVTNEDVADLNSIDYLENNSFLIAIKNKIIKLDIDMSNQTYEISNVKNDFKEEVRKIRVFEDNDIKAYLALYGSNNLYLSNWSNVKNKYVNNNIIWHNQESNDSIHTFKIKNDNSLLLGYTGRIKVLNLDSLKLDIHYVHDEQLNTIDVNKNGQILVGSRDNGANLLSADNKVLKQFIGHSAPIQNVSFVKGDYNYITTSSEDKTIKIWNITPIGIDVFMPPSPSSQYRDPSPTSTGVVLNDPITPEPSVSIKEKEKKEDSLDIIQNKKYLFEHIDQNTPTAVSKHIKTINDIDYSENGKFAISGGMDNVAIIWRLQDSLKSQYDALRILSSHTNDIIDVDFYADSLLLTASTDHTIQIYRKETENDQFTQIPSLIRHEYPIKSASFSIDGSYIISKDIKGDIKKWDFNHFNDAINNRIMYQDTIIDKKPKEENWIQKLLYNLFTQ